MRKILACLATGLMALGSSAAELDIMPLYTSELCWSGAAMSGNTASWTEGYGGIVFNLDNKDYSEYNYIVMDFEQPTRPNSNSKPITPMNQMLRAIARQMPHPPGLCSDLTTAKRMKSPRLRSCRQSQARPISQRLYWSTNSILILCFLKEAQPCPT